MSTNAIELGHTVGWLSLKLRPNSAMPATSLVLLGGGVWPPGTAATLRFANGVQWAAVVDGADLTWTATAAMVAAQADGTSVSVYVNDTEVFAGQVSKRG